MVKLNPELQQAIDARPAEPIRLVDERTGTAYVLVRADHYEELEAAAAEDQFDIREAYPLMDAVARQEGWADVEMESYDQPDPRAKP